MTLRTPANTLPGRAGATSSSPAAFVLFLGLCTGAGACAATPPTPAPLTVASDLDNLPFAGIDADGTPTGRDVEMMELLGELIGRPLVWRRMPFDALLAAVEAGEVDAVCATLGITPEREERVVFSRPYFETAIAVVVRTGAGEPRTLADLEGRRVSAARATTSERAVRRHLAGTLGIFENERGLPAERRLLEHEVDAAVMDGPAADALVAASAGRLVRLSEDLDRERYALALPRNHADLVRRLNRALKTLESDGRLQGLNERFGLSRP